MISQRMSKHLVSLVNYKLIGKQQLATFLVRREMHLKPNTTLINGNWIAAADNKQLAVLNPVNGANVGNVPDMSADDAQKAIDAASTAFHSPKWSGLTAKDRSNLLKVTKIECLNIS